VVPSQGWTRLTRQAESDSKNNMGKVCRIVQIGLVWSAAFMTLLAGIPHSECRCPNGQVKPFCLGSPSKTSGCCCGGGCCSPDSDGSCCKRDGSVPSAPAEEKPSCCQGHTPQVDEAVRGHSPVEGTSPSPPRRKDGSPTQPSSTHGAVVVASGCQRTMANAEIVVVTPGKADTKNHKTAGVDGPAPAARLHPCSLVPWPCRLSWDRHRLPPPTDLVVCLQHFVI
jgi:hypothetical protein